MGAEEYDRADALSDVVAAHDDKRRASRREAEELRRQVRRECDPHESHEGIVSLSFLDLAKKLSSLHDARRDKDREENLLTMTAFEETSRRLGVEGERLASKVRVMEQGKHFAAKERK